MDLVIPDGVPVHITIGNGPPLLALPHETDVRVVPAPRGSSGGRLVKSVLAAVLLFGSFQVGRFTGHHVDTVSNAQAASEARAAPVPATQADQAASTEIPPAFRNQMAQAPQVSPPPGQAPRTKAGTSGPTEPPASNPFGLHE